MMQNRNTLSSDAMICVATLAVANKSESHDAALIHHEFKWERMCRRNTVS